MPAHFHIEDLSVGYHGKALIEHLSFDLEKGKILSIIGPNGAGKTTVLKSISRQLELLGGRVLICGEDLATLSPKALSRQMSLLLTDSVRPEWMSCSEVVALGRSPYTNALGKLREEDLRIVRRSLERVHALDLADQDFSTLSDGQRQRVMLARAICQEPDVIILDEPTAYLDIRHKIELLDILRDMARDDQVTVIMSLHEIDLAMKISDKVLCIRENTFRKFGSPDQVLDSETIHEIWDIQSGSYNLLLGSLELSGPAGDPRIFVLGGGGYGIPCYRALQKMNIPFASGILFENDVDYQVASKLCEELVSVPAFEAMGTEAFDSAWKLIQRCGKVLDAGAPYRALNQLNARLFETAEKHGIPSFRMKPGKESAGDICRSLFPD